MFRDSDGKPLPGDLEIPFVSFLPLDERCRIPADSREPETLLYASHLVILLLS